MLKFQPNGLNPSFTPHIPIFLLKSQPNDLQPSIGHRFLRGLLTCQILTSTQAQSQPQVSNFYANCGLGAQIPASRLQIQSQGSKSSLSIPNLA